jgi:CubicO group peptidase (beta-lactamase class C family)
MASASERIRAYVERHRSTLDTPGLALGLTDRDAPLDVLVDGLANLDAGTPVQAHHRFQIGSISKGLTAAAILQEVEAGRIALDAPVRTYLPWFEVPSRFEVPITVHHLLSHTSGLACGLDATGDAVPELLALRETEVGWEPGSRFGYSNAGYKALGLVLEAVTGRPWWETVRERVMAPIGMADADVIVTHEVRSRLAVGYCSPFDDRPWVSEHGFAPAPWFPTATADGTICANAEELTAFARLLLRGGRGVLSEASFARMTERVANDPTEPGHVFGYGVKWVDGDRLLGHSGGMVGYTAYLLVDVVAGVGATVLMNSGIGARRLELARFALTCLAAEAAGDRLPEVPPPPERTPPIRPEPGDGTGPEGWRALAGRYRSWNPWAPVLDITARAGRLWARLAGDALGWGDTDQELVPLDDGRYRVGEPWSPDRLRFEAFVDGRAHRAVLDGAPFARAVV